jgi:hypothetical protein
MMYVVKNPLVFHLALQDRDLYRLFFQDLLPTIP